MVRLEHYKAVPRLYIMGSHHCSVVFGSPRLGVRKNLGRERGYPARAFAVTTRAQTGFDHVPIEQQLEVVVDSFIIIFFINYK